MKIDWLDQAMHRLQAEPKQPDTVFERLLAEGMINEQGEVTGKLHRWDAFLAITQVRHQGKQISYFRCLKPVFGLPGNATIDVSRASMVEYLRGGKKIITAIRDDRLDLWMEGCAVRLSQNGAITCGCANDVEDNVGSLPEFPVTNSRP